MQVPLENRMKTIKCKDTGEEYSTYRDYLNLSNHWKRFKLKLKHNFKIQQKHCCIICSSKTKLEVHHKTYKNIGNESENDVVLLCSGCHRYIHEMPRENREYTINNICRINKGKQPPTKKTKKNKQIKEKISIPVKKKIKNKKQKENKRKDKILLPSTRGTGKLLATGPPRDYSKKIVLSVN